MFWHGLPFPDERNVYLELKKRIFQLREVGHVFQLHDTYIKMYVKIKIKKITQSRFLSLFIDVLSF